LASTKLEPPYFHRSINPERSTTEK